MKIAGHEEKSRDTIERYIVGKRKRERERERRGEGGRGRINE